LAAPSAIERQLCTNCWSEETGQVTAAPELDEEVLTAFEAPLPVPKHDLDFE